MQESKKPSSENIKRLSTEVESKKARKLNSKNQPRKSFIPKTVANRMARRIVFTTGIPTLLGMGVFILSYFLIIKGITDVPPSITLTTSAVCFLVGLLGLSYGILSASWEDSAGSILGLENIRPNFSRLRSAFKPIKTSEKK